MIKETFFSKMPPAMKLVLLAGIIFLGLLISGILTILISVLYTHGGIADIAKVASDLTSPENVFLLKIMQLINHLGMFIMPALVFAFLVTRKPVSYLKLGNRISLRCIVYVLIIVLAVMPILDVLVNLNESINFPSGIEAWMKATENQATQLTEAFLNVNTYRAFFFNLFLIALIPAIGEEFIFRGSLQKILIDWIKNPHVAIFITAATFSAVHLQFYGFIPRMFLGVILGYIFFWTDNIWYPILLHFMNNAFTVVMYFLKNRGIFDIEPIEKRISGSVLIVIFSTVFLITFLFLIQKKQKKIISDSQQL